MRHYTPTILRNTITLILAGGQGERLFPLTKDRSKPSVPFAGSYRIIDFSLSNCINSALRRIFVLTQYKSQSLNRHLRDGWNLLSRELNEFIENVPPQKRIHSHWYEGTSDAIFQNIFLIEQFKPERILVLSGDHIYRMDYRDLIAYHLQKNADVTIASYEYPSEKARDFGVMKVNQDGRVIDFIEKPDNPPEIPGKPGCSLVNMGIYIFNTPCLVRSVIQENKNPSSNNDLGKNVFPRLVKDENAAVYAFPFNNQGSHNPYWRDVGSLSSYYNSSMDLLDKGQAFDLFSRDWPFRSASVQLPPSQLNLNHNNSVNINQSLISLGCRIEGALNKCVISPGVNIGEGSQLNGCIVFNGVDIGRNCRIKNTIIDKGVRIPDGCEIGYNPEVDSQQFMVTNNHLTIIPKGMVVEKDIVVDDK